jgi:hypothetical protein
MGVVQHKGASVIILKINKYGSIDETSKKKKDKVSYK